MQGDGTKPLRVEVLVHLEYISLPILSCDKLLSQRWKVVASGHDDRPVYLSYVANRLFSRRVLCIHLGQPSPALEANMASD